MVDILTIVGFAVVIAMLAYMIGVKRG